MLVLVLLLVAAFPWGMFRGLVERRLTARLGAPVAIAAMERVDPLSLAPRIRLHDVAVGQPGWAGAGQLATVRAAEVRLPVLPLLIGRARIDAVTLDGAVLDLRRDAGGRENWHLGGSRRGGDGLPPTILVRSGRLRMTDLRRHMRFEGPLSADAGGLRLDGAGTHRGRPMRIAVRIGPAHAGQPLRLVIVSPLLRFDALVRLDRPYILRRMEGDVRASGDDARILDDAIEAGLPGTQAFRLDTHVRRDGDEWHLAPLNGTVGGSRISANLDITRPGGRVRLDGTIRAPRLNFEDFASDEGQAESRAREARLGPRIVPFTRIDLSRLTMLDAHLRIVSPRFVVRGAPMFRTLAAAVDLDRRKLKVAPLTLGLDHGRLAGRIGVDHRSGPPQLTVDMRLARGSLQELFGSDLMRAPLDARMRITGSGEDFRAAVARSTGFVALVARDGDVGKRMAALAGGDVLDRTDKNVRTTLRCMIVRLDARPGRLSASTLLIDTDVSRIDAVGAVTLPDERMAMVLTGRSKQPDFIRAAPSVRLTGTLSNPRMLFPAVQRRRGFFGKVGAVLKVLRVGKQQDVAPDADCSGLAARALG